MQGLRPAQFERTPPMGQKTSEAIMWVAAATNQVALFPALQGCHNYLTDLFRYLKAAKLI